MPAYNNVGSTGSGANSGSGLFSGEWWKSVLTFQPIPNTPPLDSLQNPITQKVVGAVVPSGVSGVVLGGFVVLILLIILGRR